MPSGPFKGRIGAMRSMPGWDSQDFAEDTSRLATSAPRFWASAPTTQSGEACQGSAIDPSGKSDVPGRYKNEGSNGGSRTSPGFTSCGISNKATGGCSRGSWPSAGAYASAQFVVPKSIPITYGLGKTGKVCTLV